VERLDTKVFRFSGAKVLEGLKGEGGTVMKTSLDHTKEAALQEALAGVQAVVPTSSSWRGRRLLPGGADARDLDIALKAADASVELALARADFDAGHVLGRRRNHGRQH
jgi:hypothetical protein